MARFSVLRGSELSTSYTAMAAPLVTLAGAKPLLLVAVTALKAPAPLASVLTSTAVMTPVVTLTGTNGMTPAGGLWERSIRRVARSAKTALFHPLCVVEAGREKPGLVRE